MTENANETELGAELRYAVGRLYWRFRNQKVDGSLGDAALDVLTHLHKHGPKTLTELSERARVAPASMSQSVNRLTSAGYAVRTADPDDRRKVRFELTPMGAASAESAANQRNAWLESRLAALSLDDRAILVRASALLSEIADSEAADR